MNRRNLVVGTLVAGWLALPLLAAAQGSSGASSGAPTDKPAQSATEAQAAPSSPSASQPAATNAHSTSSTSKSSAHKSAPKVDLNSATKEQLAKVPGINDETADKIVAARPFKSKKELVSKKIVTEEEYKTISLHVIAKQPASATASK